MGFEGETVGVHGQSITTNPVTPSTTPSQGTDKRTPLPISRLISAAKPVSTMAIRGGRNSMSFMVFLTIECLAGKLCRQKK
jgi:hypothetical protein